MATPTKRETGDIPYRWLLGSLLVVLFLLALNIYVESSRASSQELAVGPTAVSESTTEEVRFRAWADRKKALATQRLRVYWTLENGSDSALEEIRLDVVTTGFNEKDIRRCWQERKQPRGCGAGLEHPKVRTGILGGLRKGGSTTLWADMKPVPEPGDRSVIGLLSWRAKEGENKTALSVGPIEVAAQGESGFLILSRAILSFLKDLALPLALGLLAYAFQRLQQERTAAQETFREMLSRAHENVVHHLLGITGATNRFLNRLDDAKGPPGRKKTLALQQTLFYLLSLVKRMRELSSKGGGIFFVSLQGETVVYICWKEIWARVEEKLGAAEVSEVLDQLDDTNESFTSLQRKFRAPHLLWYPTLDPAAAAFAEVERSFCAWIPFFSLERELLKVLSEVMQYEINKLYGPWYGEAPEFPRRAIEDLRSHGGCPGGLREELNKYLEMETRGHL